MHKESPLHGGSHDSSMPDEFVTLLAGVPTKEVIVLTTTFFTSTFSAPNPQTFTQHIDKLARNQSWHLFWKWMVGRWFISYSTSIFNFSRSYKLRWHQGPTHWRWSSDSSLLWPLPSPEQPTHAPKQQCRCHARCLHDGCVCKKTQAIESNKLCLFWGQVAANLPVICRSRTTSGCCFCIALRMCFLSALSYACM